MTSPITSEELASLGERCDDLSEELRQLERDLKRASADPEAHEVLTPKAVTPFATLAVEASNLARTGLFCIRAADDMRKLKEGSR